MRDDPNRLAGAGRYVVWDVETLRLSYEVRGGWRSIKDFGLAVAVTVDDRGVREVWQEDDASGLIRYLARYPCIVGFNCRRFDLEVLSAYGPVDHLHEPTLDLLESIRNVTGRRKGLSLQNIAQTMFGVGKGLADGTEAVRLWRTGRTEDRQRVIDYCAQDVELTRRILEFGMTHGYVMVPLPDVRHGGSPLAAQVAVSWADDTGLDPGPRLIDPEGADF